MGADADEVQETLEYLYTRCHAPDRATEITMDVDANARPIDDLSSEPRRSVCRSHLWLEAPFPVTVRGVDTDGNAFQVQTVLDHLGARGFSVRLTRCVQPGTKLFAVICLSHPTALNAPGPRVAVRGVVQGTSLARDGQYGVQVQFTRHRFL